MVGLFTAHGWAYLLLRARQAGRISPHLRSWQTADKVRSTDMWHYRDCHLSLTTDGEYMHCGIY